MEYYIQMELKIYLLFWLSAVLVACCLVLRNKEVYAFFDRPYWVFLFEPWKLTTFAIATLGITLAAPYSGDPTWDIPDSIIISILTYIIAPWSVGTLYRNVKAKMFKAQFFVALCFFFVPCWAYDLYILLRDKMYPSTWCENLFISGGIVFLAGLFWNLVWQEDRGVTFAFTRDEWPPQQRTPFKKVIWLCFLLAAPVVASVGWFVITYFWDWHFLNVVLPDIRMKQTAEVARLFWGLRGLQFISLYIIKKWILIFLCNFFTTFNR